MSLILHILYSQHDAFKDNKGVNSKERCERFTRASKIFEYRYQEMYNENIIGAYIWRLD